MSNDLDEAIRKLETKHRFESYLMKIGASEEAAKLISSSPEQLAKVSYDGVDFRFNKSDLAAADDPAAKAYFLEGPFKALFVAPADKVVDDKPALDEALVASAKAGNYTAKGQLLRQLGSMEAVDALLADKPVGHDKTNNEKNPFKSLRDRTGKIDPAVQLHIAGMIKNLGTAKVTAIAKAAGMTLSGEPLRK